MKINLLLGLFLFAANLLPAQKAFNFDFEKFDPGSGKPIEWKPGTDRGKKSEFEFAIDSTHAMDGHYCARLSNPENAGPFAIFHLLFPATFEGERITLKGYVKTDHIAQDGWAGLWIRLDGASGMVDYGNMEKVGLKGTNAWRPFELSLRYTKEVQQIVLGGLVSGTGTAWFDHLELLVDEKPMETAPARIVVKQPAEFDTLFNSGSRVHLGEMTKSRVNDLVLLGKIWGFLKYHHPKIAAGELNWDYELFRFLPQYPEGLNARQRDELLLAWIKSLGDLPECSSCNQKLKGTLQVSADLKWLEDSRLSIDLRTELRRVYEHRNQSAAYYIDMDKDIGNPIFQHESAYAQFKYPDEGFRLLCVYRYWNIIQYFYPHREAIGEDWTNVLEEFIPKILKVSDALSYKLTTLELIGRIHDSHANLTLEDAELNRFFGEKRPAVQLRFIENQAVVTGYYHPVLGPQTGLLPGDVLTSIEGVSVKNLVQNKLPYCPGSNRAVQLRDIAIDLLRTNSDTLHIKIQRAKAILDFELPCLDENKEKFNFEIDRTYRLSDTCYRFLTPEIGYLNLGNTTNALLPEIMEKFKDTKGLILDMRSYPSDYLVYSLTKFFLCKPTPFLYTTKGNVGTPGAFTYTKVLKCGGENENPYTGKLILLVNEMTQSAAEYHSLAFLSVPGAKVVGSTTAGADGNVSSFALPGGLSSMITGTGIYYPDGRPTQRLGIVPDYKVLPSIAGVKAGKDEVLEFAMKLMLK